MSGSLPHIEEIVREVQFALGAGCAWHYAKGQCARAQDEAVKRGWLAPVLDNPRRLVATPIGRAELQKRREHRA